MRKLLCYIAAIMLLASCGSPFMGAPAVGPADLAGLDVVPVTTDVDLAADPAVNFGYVIVKVTADFDEAKFEKLGADIDSWMTINGGRYYRLQKSDNVSKFINTLRLTRGVLYAEPELVSERVLPVATDDATSRALGAGDLALDPSSAYGDYALAVTKALDSYKAVVDGGNGYGANTVYVAVIDTGINWTHQDFWIDGTTSIVEYAKSAFTKNADGSFTWVGNANPLVSIPEGENWDDQAHGTHVTGTIAALGDNNIGVAGVAWKQTRVISYKCFADSTNGGSGADWSIYGALGDLAAWIEDQRTNHGFTQATVPVNMSLGGDYAGNFEFEMINYALSQGVLPVVAMGNDGMYIGQFPASYQGVLAVGATNGKDEKVHFSNSGHWISVSAPGYDILSTGNGSSLWNDDASDYRETETQWMSGTSMATPFVTGVIGYLLSFDDTLTPYQVKAVLEQTADDINNAALPGFDTEIGYGRVNVLDAATMVRTGTGLPADGSLYVNSKIVVYVDNTADGYDSGLGAGLEDRVIGQTISLYDAVGQFVALGLTNGTDGAVEFRGLPAGDYTVKTNFFGDLGTQALTLADGADQAATFTFSKSIVFISTVANAAYNEGADGTDSVITVYSDEALTVPVAGPYDQALLDTLSAVLDPGTYYAKISSYQDDYSLTAANYAIQIGFSQLMEANVADGARLATDDDSHEVDDAGADATAKGAIALDTPFAANLLNEDVFMFVVP